MGASVSASKPTAAFSAPSCCARPLLDLGVVRRHERRAPRAARASSSSARASAAPSIGSVPAATSSSSTSVRGRRAEHVHEVAQVARERRQRGRDRLLVADVGQHSSKTGSRARSAGRAGRTGGAARTSPSVFSATVLPPVLAPRHDEHAHARAAAGRSGPPSRIEQRVARRDQLDVVGRLDGAAAPAARERAAGEREVELGQHLDGRGHVGCRGADLARQLGQDARDLVALVALELAQPVGQLDDRERLDEQRLARVARVVDDARHGAARARAHGDHGPPAALGHEILLQVRAQARGQLPQSLGGPLARDRVLASQRTQLRRGAVADALLIDRLLDRERELVESGCDRVRARREQRQLLAPARQGATRLECGAQRQRHGEEHLGIERDRAGGARHILAHVGRTDELGRAEHVEPERLGCARLTARDDRGVRRRRERERERPAALERRLGREHVEHRGQLEHGKGSVVHVPSVDGALDFARWHPATSAF